MTPTTGKGPPVQPLTVFLVKGSTGNYKDALEEPGKLKRYRLKASLPFSGALFLAPQRTIPPRWLSFLEDGTTKDLENLYNASTSAVLFVRASKRVFAFTFGYGRSLLRPERIERSFGLRVVLNIVAEEGLRSVDTKTVQELTVHTRRQTSRASRLAEFSIDKEEDLLGSVAGVPRDLDLGRMVSGADALQFRASVKFRDLGNRCRTILTAYRRHDYKKRGFEFMDHVRTLTDPTLVEKLDDELVVALAQEEFDGVHMAPPEIIEWTTTDGFSFVQGTDPEPELRLESFFSQIRKSDEMSVARLKRQRVFVHSSHAAEPVRRWPVYRVIVAERNRQGHRYVLSGGEWYAVDPVFAQSIKNRAAKIKAANLRLPSAHPEETEVVYNKRAARRAGVYFVDRKCPRVDGDPIELCDLFTSRRQFVHVKRWKASSTLSHLFAQGRVSAEAFISDQKFRDEARKLLKQEASSLAAHVPVGRPDASKYQIVFAIIKGGGKGWKGSLPFFSQLHLVRSAEALRRLGFEVRLERIVVE